MTKKQAMAMLELDRSGGPNGPSRYYVDMAHDHDTGYKLLFSHPEMVRDLLTGFVQGEWLKEADFSTLTPVHGSYVTQTDDPEQRHDDLVWKIRIKDRWLYVYLLLEFQSSTDPLMALRMMVYVGLLYQDLAKRKEFAPDGKLPPVLPIVLYNGQPRWTAPVSLAELVTVPPPGLEAYVPHCRYLLLDEGRYGADVLNPLHNLVAALFRLETQRGLDDVRTVVDALIEWLTEEDQRSVRRAFAIWIKRMLRTQLPDAVIDGINDLQEVRAMLAENIKSWFEEHEDKGRQEGRQEGEALGRQQGEALGRQQGEALGRQQGEALGRQQGEALGRQQGEALGRQQGEALALQRLLSKRFGAIPSDITVRIAAASANQIETWFDLAIDARQLSDIFGES
jgi:hypothetical protein